MNVVKVWFTWWLGLYSLILKRIVCLPFVIITSVLSMINFYANDFQIHNFRHNFIFRFCLFHRHTCLLVYESQMQAKQWIWALKSHSVTFKSVAYFTHETNAFASALLTYPRHLKIQICRSAKYRCRNLTARAYDEKKNIFVCWYCYSYRYRLYYPMTPWVYAKIHLCSKYCSST